MRIRRSRSSRQSLKSSENDQVYSKMGSGANPKIDRILLQKTSKIQEDSFGNKYVDGVMIEAIEIQPKKQ